MAEDCPAKCDIKAGLLDCLDSVLGVRDCIGANLADMYIITRKWTGKRVGDGKYTEEAVTMKPTPQIKDYGHDIRIGQAGAMKQGDLILVGISKNKFPEESTLRTDTGIKNVEKLWKIGDHYYRVKHIKSNLVTWDVHVTKVLKDENEK